jgi:arylsulfatase A-like enzyme
MSPRPRRRLLRTFPALALLLALGGCGRDNAAPAPRRVFLITIDTLRADHMSLHGYPRETSPRIQALAGGGVRFEHAIAQWPKTGASFASLFTGLYPHTTGLTQKAALRVPESYLTLPELFRESGYTTVAVVSNAVLGAQLGWDDGFDEFVQSWGEGEFPADATAFRGLVHAPRVNAVALPLLERHAGDERLFAWIHYIDPHAPYRLPPGEENPFLDDAQYRGEERVPPGAARGYRLDGRDDRKFYVAQYDANVRLVDAHVGALVDRLSALGMLEDALIIVTSDHGESLGEHDSWFEHGPLPYNTTARVPLVVFGAGVAEERVVTRPVELVDLYPTLRDLVAPGREVEGLAGRSLLPWLSRGGGGSAAEGFEHAFSAAGEGRRQFRSVQDGAWKLVQAFDRRRRAAPAASGAFELYDLGADPLETRNLAAAQPEEVRRLRGALLRWERSLGEGAAPPQGEDADAERALRALGYAN